MVLCCVVLYEMVWHGVIHVYICLSDANMK
jgi:hypothetical protein